MFKYIEMELGVTVSIDLTKDNEVIESYSLTGRNNLIKRYNRNKSQQNYGE